MKTDKYHPAYSERFGITKREYFAAIALQGVLSNTNINIDKGTARLAVILADQLIEALNKEEAKCGK